MDALFVRMLLSRRAALPTSFLEYDRGTERRREYASKLDAYFRYRDTGWAARDCDGFPTILFATSAESSEDVFAQQAYLAAMRHGAGLPLLLTTTRLIQGNGRGVFGAIWRSSGPIGGLVTRRHWLPCNVRQTQQFTRSHALIGRTPRAECVTTDVLAIAGRWSASYACTGKGVISSTEECID